jgi:hypothetical protein
MVDVKPSVCKGDGEEKKIGYLQDNEIKQWKK